jgi:hypothetical protein
LASVGLKKAGLLAPLRVADYCTFRS